MRERKGEGGERILLEDFVGFFQFGAEVRVDVLEGEADVKEGVVWEEQLVNVLFFFMSCVGLGVG